MAKTDVKELLDAGVHFGHLTRKWNPNMAPYIYMERDGIHIINLYKTAAKLEEAVNALKKIVISGRKILFVATKKQAKDIVAEKAKSVDMPYITERWPGGMLTNFVTIRKAVKKMVAIDRMKQDGTFGDLYFNELLNDWSKFDINKRTKHDASISSGLAVMANNRHLYRPNAKVEKPKLNINVSKYSNTGNNSQIIK